MARFLLCWEFGGGLGHAGRLKPLARLLMQRGHQVDLALRDIVHTRALLSDLADLPGMRVLQAPVWLHQTVGLPEPLVSLTEILMGNGYLKADHLHGLVAGWRALMALTQADVVVADYAPTATIAARSLNLPAASVGAGFYVPPDVSPLPPFRTWEHVPPARIVEGDKVVLRAVNTVLQDLGAAPCAKLVDIFRGDLPLLCTWPELDHYRRGPLPDGQRYLGPTFLPESGDKPGHAGDEASHWPDLPGPKVFAYLRASHPDHALVLRALDQAGCATLCYLPEVAAGKPAPVSSPRIRYAAGPVHLGQTLPQAELMVSHGGEASLTQALLAGLPVLLLPTHAEQFLMAQRVEEAGAGLNAAAHARPVPFQTLLAQLVNEPRFRQGAQALAQSYAGFSHEAQTQELVEAIASLRS